MTEKKSDFAIKQQNWLFPSVQFALKNGPRPLSNLKAIVNAVSNNPKHLIVSRKE